jgi:hypothetical protein
MRWLSRTEFTRAFSGHVVFNGKGVRVNDKEIPVKIIILNIILGFKDGNSQYL